MFTIFADIAAAERLLSDIGRRQMPFATARALNDTASDVKQAEERGIETAFDRPTPFTKRGIYVRRASKSRLYAEVGMKRVQAKYLEMQAKGGTRSPAGKAILMPIGVRLNKYGNIPRGGVKRAASRADVFVAGRGKAGTKHLRPGVYQRGRKKRGGTGSPKLLVAFEDRATYKARWSFQTVAMREARSRFRSHFLARFAQAMASRR